MANARFFVIVAVLLSAMAWVMVSSVREEAQTWDEAIHLAAGYSYWKTGDYRMNPEHPPLAKLLNALPLLAVNPPLPLQHPSWLQADEFKFGLQFLYFGPESPRDLLFRARLMTILLTLLFGACLALWARAYFSDWVAIAVLAFFCFDPTVIAHGRYVTTDLAMGFASFAACAAWLWWLEKGAWWRLALSGIALGAAMATKFSWPFLAIVFPLVALAVRAPWKRAVALPVAILVGAVVVAASYPGTAQLLIPATKSYRSAHPDVVLLGKAIENTSESKTTLGGAASFLSYRLGVQNHPYLLGILKYASHAKTGHSAYLLGQVSDSGWWYYFPVALAVKEPTGLLIGVFLCLFALKAGNGALRMALIVVVLYMAVAMLASINIGIRHLMPLLPFLYVAVAAILFQRAPHLLLACTLLTAAETAWRYPHYLPFFNGISGGPANGMKYLADSNLDWGQDFIRLRNWRDANLGGDHLCLAYFGGASMEYYGLAGSPVPATDDSEGRKSVDCIAAVSTTLLAGAYEQPRTYEWLRAMRPYGRVGYTYYLYDLRR